MDARRLDNTSARGQVEPTHDPDQFNMDGSTGGMPALRPQSARRPSSHRRAAVESKPNSIRLQVRQYSGCPAWFPQATCAGDLPPIPCNCAHLVQIILPVRSVDPWWYGQNVQIRGRTAFYSISRWKDAIFASRSRFCRVPSLRACHNGLPRSRDTSTMRPGAVSGVAWPPHYSYGRNDHS